MILLFNKDIYNYFNSYFNSAILFGFFLFLYLANLELFSIIKKLI